MKTNLKVLIVDDNSPFTLLVGRYLKKMPLWQIEYLICKSAKDAIAKSCEFAPTVAIIDYILGNETGIDLISKLKKNGCKAAFILLTGVGSEMAATEAIRAGVNDYLSKNELTPETLERSLLRILEHKKSKDALQLERDKLTLILESMRDGVYIVDQFNEVKYINPVIEKEFGTPRGRKCYEYFHDRTQACPWCKSKDVFAGKTVQWEWYSQKTNKTYDLLDTPLQNSDGSISKLEIFRDISGRKQMEEMLKHKTELMQLQQEITVTANEASTVDEAMQVCIDKVCAYTGWPVGHVYIPDPTGKLFSSNLWYLEKPRQFETFRKVTEVTPFDIGVGLPGRVLASGKPAWITDVTKDSNFPRAQLATDLGVKGGLAFPVLEGKKVAAVLEFFSDEAKEPDKFLLKTISNLATQIGRVTERKRAEEALRESEERFRQIAENITEVFWMMSSDLKEIIYISPAYEKIWGRTCDSLYKNPEDWLNAIHPDDIERVKEAFAVKSIKNKFDEEYRIINSNNFIRWIRDRAFVVPNNKGEILRIAGIAEDITEQRHAEEQVRHTAKLASIGQLAGGVAHEVRTCLGGMMNYAERIHADIINKNRVAEQIQNLLKKLSEYLENNELDKIHLLKNDLKSFYQQSEKYNKRLIKNSIGINEMGKRGTKITSDLLTFSRRHPPQMKPTKIDKVINNTLSVVRKEFEKSNINIITEYQSDLPSLNIDEDQINQVIMNFVLNARNAISDRGTVKISTCLNSAKKKLEIDVSDTGCGMPEDRLNKIFDPFYTTFGNGGTGLGLSVSYGIIHNHKGEISVKSKVGKGSTFRIHLPLNSSQRQDGENE